MSASGLLFVVATPIGNLEDITLRALRVLREADAILAEDTRRTRRLLAHHGIEARLQSLHAHTPISRVERFVGDLVSGTNYALVTDAGTPVVSDPGAMLVKAAHEAAVRVVPVPGPSAAVAAIAVSGVGCDSFCFLGFLPRKGSKRTQALERIRSSRPATVLFEAPTRLRATLRDLAAVAPDRMIAVCRELTKVHEEIARGRPTELLEHFGTDPKGEVSLVVEGSASGHDQDWTEEEIDRRIEELRADSRPAAEIARTVSKESGWPRRAIWQRVVQDDEST